MSDDKVLKLMNRQLLNWYSTDNMITESDDSLESTNGGKTVVFQNTDDIVKGYIVDIHEQVGGAHTSFSDLKFTKSQNKVQWSGTISGVNWTVLYDDETSGFYISSENKQLSKEDSLAIHKMNTYFQTVWFGSIRDAILKNELVK